VIYTLDTVTTSEHRVFSFEEHAITRNHTIRKLGFLALAVDAQADRHI
jgi:hypothetical protein